MRQESELNEHDRREIAQTLENMKKSRPEKDPLTPEARAKVDHFEEKFLKLAFLTDRDEKDTITNLYIKHVAGVDPNLPGALESAAKIMNAVGPKPLDDGRQFYLSLSESLPDALTPEDIEWLIQNDPTGSGGSKLLSDMDLHRPLGIISNFMTKVHAWK